jgi:hypothetical protein
MSRETGWRILRGSDRSAHGCALRPVRLRRARPGLSRPIGPWPGPPAPQASGHWIGPPLRRRRSCSSTHPGSGRGATPTRDRCRPSARALPVESEARTSPSNQQRDRDAIPAPGWRGAQRRPWAPTGPGPRTTRPRVNRGRSQSAEGHPGRWPLRRARSDSRPSGRVRLEPRAAYASSRDAPGSPGSPHRYGLVVRGCGAGPRPRAWVV